MNCSYYFYLKKGSPAVIIVNWELDAASLNYEQVSPKTKVVGQELADLIKKLGLDSSKNVYCIGHSLGAHVCGFCGKINKLKRITGILI